MLYKVCIVTCIQNEGRYLKEWIDYHKSIGVDYFYLFNNGSDDNTLEVLKPYIDQGLVHLEDISDRPFYLSTAKETDPPIGMIAAIDEARDKMKDKAKWLAPIDVDEFIHVKTEELLPQFLRDYEKFGGLAIKIVPFGDSGVEDLKPSESLVQKLTKRAKEGNYPAYIKTIARPEVFDTFNDHLIKTKGGLGPVDSDRKLVDSILCPNCPTDKIVINHYWARTTDFAYLTRVDRIMRRYRAPKSIAKARVSNYLKVCNEVDDPSLANYAKSLGQI